MPLGDTLRHLRQRHGWTQRELARRAGVRVAVVSQLERGRVQDPRATTLRRLALALGTSMEYLTDPAAIPVLHRDVLRYPGTTVPARTFARWQALLTAMDEET
jgi:transcriptional regulator with XRE-family HTH domain